MSARIITPTPPLLGEGLSLQDFQALQAQVLRLQTELQSARKDAETDPLTGIGNRRHLERVIAQLEPDQQYVLAMFDIANLKAANDSDGHAQGDTMIQRAASVLRADSDVVTAARIGGDEFVAVLIPTTHVNYVEGVIERIEGAFGVVPCARSGVSVFLSGGAAQGPDRLDRMIARASRAMAFAKNLRKAARGCA
jgi:diguanylate cyclase (GGDEF)-like protein